MQDQTPAITPPSLPTGGGTIQSLGNGWSAAGTTGTASFSLPLPLSPGRGYAPPLSLDYHSSTSNSLFGIGWNLGPRSVARRTSKGVPRYTDEDVILGPDGQVWLPERDGSGDPLFTRVDSYRGLPLGQSYLVFRHFPRVEQAFERIEHWRADLDDPGFWLVHGSDGTLHLYGRNPASRSSDPDDPQRVGEWLLEESMNAHGEHILYQYKSEDLAGLPAGEPRDFRAQCYLSRVCYGNVQSHAWLYLWNPQQVTGVTWHFEVLLDYGERAGGLEDKPGHAEQKPWAVRSDPYSTFAFGFELGSLRLCRQVLVFHHFPQHLGPEPVLVQRLLLDYQTTPLGYNLLAAVHHQAWSSTGQRSSLPPLNFSYSAFDSAAQQHFCAFPAMPGLNDGEHYQWVDLFGEGLAGVLHGNDKGWYYREPLRDPTGEQGNEVMYGPWTALPSIPLIDRSRPPRQTLTDVTGDGRLDWCISAPGLNGYFTLGPDRRWTHFLPFAAVPPEALNPLAQLADISGSGLADLTLIGPHSVRVYPARREQGYGQGQDVRHSGNDSLPVLGDSRAELVAFSDVLGSRQQHLVRVRHNEIHCWPNLGHGTFGKGFKLAALPFSHQEFDASRVLLADLDGSGASDLLYLQSEGVQVFMNRSGFGFELPVLHPWPPGVRFDSTCQVSAADLQGLGCASLVLSVPHVLPRHWRIDFVTHKPYLLNRSDNNMGAIGCVEYRSSAQEWLDEKQQLLQDGRPAVSQLPFAVHLVTRQHQLDEITGNLLTQRMRYRGGFYDRHEREMRGFGLVVQEDSESARGSDDQHFTAPLLTKTWFHTGQCPAVALDTPWQDDEAPVVGPDVLSQYNEQSALDELIAHPDPARLRAMAHALTGLPVRSERYGLDDSPQREVPFTVEQHRYRVRELAPSSPRQPYARMLVLPLERISHDYARQTNDPRCEHSIALAHDRFGHPIHTVVIHCARRRHHSDPPPFDDEHEQRWWRDAHDDAQYTHYLNETRAEPIHLDDPQGWRLGLPWRERANALVLPRALLGPQQRNLEHFTSPESPLNDQAERVLTGQSVQRYQPAQGNTREDLPEGQATFEALPGFLESAELNEAALQAYDRVMSRSELLDKLQALGYVRMQALLPTQADLELWAVRQGFASFGPAEAFYRTQAFRETASHGVTLVADDPYHCVIQHVTLPDGCRTFAEIDYHCLQPARITDPNQNLSEALYDGFGRVLASSFHGTEGGKPVGFAPLSDYHRDSEAVADAIADPAAALQHAASACYYDAFSWMQPAERRQPVHSAVLVADRYPGDPEAQVRISLSCTDGFGRELQSKIKVESGLAYGVNENGELQLEDGQPVLVDSPERWRVSERVEYNNKGLAMRVYRPYFANQWRYINDVSFRLFGYNDQQFYDPQGRLLRTITAKGWLRRQRYLAWYSISEDENDTWEEVEQPRE